ncbi:MULTISPECIES: molybdopterin converting factor subunit 1 [Alphaproteobacteria]|uniref:Molybdopterin synthase sulfur carrier subunit n=2 Tax=Alphaproteobacteria TaxID=28211 RepID=A0A512HGI9_9HYPH|nr:MULTISPECIES: molybdopterin converting factor subunit 1 [Alphaproteobacteria]GEO84563.1 molybdopterin synthase sulfur carrier subunit [Ciceribacter naphthalenivorans]GLR22526.1 molybdopterin synthase sulfur carrier subunit [Ciceribacter naphthalenivorans]GLT05382.1 molybdopterin synthase sulfur carrier subunit [Sphingomonas psychrolutea]
MVKLVYFAWVRERIGKGEEELELPAHVKTAGDLIAYLTTLGEEYENALQFPQAIRVAVNQEHVEHDEPLTGAGEIGLFPPMTGG